MRISDWSSDVCSSDLLGKLACIACAAFPVAAYANGDASAGFRISLVVPEVCQIESSDIIVDAGSGLATGTVFEACNSGRGFRVMASHRMPTGRESWRERVGQYV